MNNLDHPSDTILQTLSDRDWMTCLSIAFLISLAALLLHCAITKRAFHLTSLRLHDCTFGRVMHVPMAFFEQSPSGMILNNFSKDMGMVDEVLLQTFLMFLVSGN